MLDGAKLKGEVRAPIEDGRSKTEGYVRTNPGRRLVGTWSLALFLGSGVFIAGCREKQEAPEQVPIAPEPKPPIAPEVPPPTEQKTEPSEKAAPEEVTRGAAPAERVAPTRQAERGASGRVREGTVMSDVERLEGHVGFESTTVARPLLPRALRSGPSAGEVRVGPEVTKDVVSKPLIPPGNQPTYGFSMNVLGTSDQSRRGQHFRVETGDTPAYGTMPPITPDVSEDTVLPELQSGFP